MAQVARFFVGKRPVAVWHPSVRESDLTLLRNFDFQHFEYVALLHAGQVGTSNEARASTAIRLAYGHACETFLALVGALIQSPLCVIGWLHCYNVGDISLVAASIDGPGQALRVAFKDELTWENIAAAVYRPLVLEDKAFEAQIEQSFTSFWRDIACDFRDKGTRSEYNALKHGLRIVPGGFSIAYGPPGVVAATDEQMTSLGGSAHGGTYLFLERITDDNAIDHRVRTVSRNWDLDALIGRLRLLSMSIRNVVSYLRIIHGDDPKSMLFEWPDDMGAFAEAVRVLNAPIRFATTSWDGKPPGYRTTTQDEIEAVCPLNLPASG